MAHELLVRHLVADELKVLTPRYLDLKGWELNSSEFPVLDVTIHGSRPLRIRMDCQNWPESPPSAELLEVNGEVLKGSTNDTFAIFNMHPHPITKKPFICMRGFREYHNHESHLNVLWEDHRREDGNNLIGLLEQVSRSWRGKYPR